MKCVSCCVVAVALVAPQFAVAQSAVPDSPLGCPPAELSRFHLRKTPNWSWQAALSLPPSRSQGRSTRHGRWAFCRTARSSLPKSRGGCCWLDRTAKVSHIGRPGRIDRGSWRLHRSRGRSELCRQRHNLPLLSCRYCRLIHHPGDEGQAGRAERNPHRPEVLFESTPGAKPEQLGGRIASTPAAISF